MPRFGDGSSLEGTPQQDGFYLDSGSTSRAGVRLLAARGECRAVLSEGGRNRARVGVGVLNWPLFAGFLAMVCVRVRAFLGVVSQAVP